MLDLNYYINRKSCLVGITCKRVGHVPLLSTGLGTTKKKNKPNLEITSELIVGRSKLKEYIMREPPLMRYDGLVEFST